MFEYKLLSHIYIQLFC